MATCCSGGIALNVSAPPSEPVSVTGAWLRTSVGGAEEADHALARETETQVIGKRVRSTHARTHAVLVLSVFSCVLLECRQ